MRPNSGFVGSSRRDQGYRAGDVEFGGSARRGWRGGSEEDEGFGWWPVEAAPVHRECKAAIVAEYEQLTDPDAKGASPRGRVCVTLELSTGPPGMLVC